MEKKQQNKTTFSSLLGIGKADTSQLPYEKYISTLPWKGGSLTLPGDRNNELPTVHSAHYSPQTTAYFCPMHEPSIQDLTAFLLFDF